MSTSAGPPVLLSIVTVVRNDLPGLQRTLHSTRSMQGESFEQIVIDGSDDANIRTHLEAMGSPGWLRWVSEPDRGIYDAMNKGFARALGRYVLFLNAGDALRSEFASDWPMIEQRLRAESCVLIGHVVDVYQSLSWLRPGIGHERDVFHAPAHQATFYPRRHYTAHSFRLDAPVSADGEYTGLAIKAVGAAYLGTVVSEFELGGLSSNYVRWSRLRSRLREHPGDHRMRLKLLFKFILWRLLPRPLFYRALALGKYTPLKPQARIRLAPKDLRVAPATHSG